MSGSSSVVSSTRESEVKTQSTSASFVTKGEESKHNSRSHRSSHRSHHRSRSPNRRRVIKCLTVTESTAGILVPEGATSMEILLIGGGGGGGAAAGEDHAIPRRGGGGGGGGGTYENLDFCVQAGTTLEVVIGAGGEGGPIEGANGANGGDTILRYGSFKKVAHGGKGGGGAFNGSFGGKGGRGEGLGNNGDNGYTNVHSLLPGVKLQGGAGGLSGLTEQSPYGNGGYGQTQEEVGPAVTIHPLATSASLAPSTSRVAPQAGRGRPTVEAAWVPPRGGWLPPPNSGTVTTSSTASVTPATSGILSASNRGIAPLSNSVTAATTVMPATISGNCSTSYAGSSGFCRLTFFSLACTKESRAHENRCREIVITDSQTIYLVDPNTKLTVIDSRNFSANLSLGKPRKRFTQVTLKLLTQRSLPVFVRPVSGGTFLLSPTNPILTLVYNNCVWNIVDNTQDVSSFYPTQQQGPDLVPHGFKGENEFVAPGIAISADGNTLVMGAASDDGGIGAAFVYVLQNDCWVQQAKLVGNDYTGMSAQGLFVDISADGNTLAVAGPGDNDTRGAVWIFIRDENGCWVQQGNKLTNISCSSYLFSGGGVALSASGNVLAVGEPGQSEDEGGVWIYKRECGNWIQGAHLVGNPSPLGISQGLCVDISSDGKTVAAGSVADTVWIFIEENGGWSQQGAPLTGMTSFGYSLALSADGNTLAVGSPFNDETEAGAVTVFIREGGYWQQQGPPLQVIMATPLQEVTAHRPVFEPSYQGTALALSADGNTLLVGGLLDREGEGNTWVWTRVNSNWQRCQKLVNGVLSTYNLRGAFPSISSDGNTTAIKTVAILPAPPIALAYI